jgi:hypothetical protein
MLAIFNEPPRHCPNCGRVEKWDNSGRQDFYAGASHTCPDCGLHFAYVTGPKLLKLAAETGDIGRYVTPQEVE